MGQNCPQSSLWGPPLVVASLTLSPPPHLPHEKYHTYCGWSQTCWEQWHKIRKYKTPTWIHIANREGRRKIIQMNNVCMITEIQSLSRSWSRSAKAHHANSNYSAIFKKGKAWTGYWAIIRLIPLYGFKAGSRFETRHTNNDLCYHSKEGTSKKLIFSCPAALCLAAMGQSL